MSIDPWNLYAPRFFSRQEFGEWASDMDVALLVLLDSFRALLGRPVHLSRHPMAIGRRGGTNSQHDVDTWGVVRAVDTMPEGVRTPEELRHAMNVARTVGFTGIGVYPDWHPSPGLHLDVRRSHRPGAPAMWGGIRRLPESTQEYVSVDEAFTHMGEQLA